MIVKRIVTNIATADVSKGSPIAVIGKIESATSGPSAEKLCADLRRAGVSYCEVQRARSTRWERADLPRPLATYLLSR